MKRVRTQFGLTSWNNHIAIAGGRSSLLELEESNHNLASVEIYNAEKEVWETLIEAKESRISPVMCYFKEKLYVIGGIKFVDEAIELKDTVNKMSCNSIEMFDLLNKTACFIEISTQIHSFITACACSPLADNSLLLLSSTLLGDHQEFSQCELKIDSEKKEATINVYGTDNDEFYGYSSQNCVLFGNKYIVFPFNNTLINDSNCGLLIEYDLANSDGIWLGSDRQRVLIQVSSQVAAFFRRRNLLPNQVIEQETPGGDILISTTVAQAEEVLPIIRYWIPHVRILEPIAMQQQLEETLASYLEAARSALK